MPIYEYNCKSCGNSFECMQRITEPPIAPCPKCGSTADRMISMTSFTLKGGGWYKDGYASKGSGSGSRAKKSDSTSSKPETKK